MEKGWFSQQVVATATAKALIGRSNLEHLTEFDIENSSWANSLFNQMGFVKRTATTGRPGIQESAKKEAKTLLLCQIVDLVEESNIPVSLILNLDLGPLKYLPVSSQTLENQGSKHIGTLE